MVAEEGKFKSSTKDALPSLRPSSACSQRSSNDLELLFDWGFLFASRRAGLDITSQQEQYRCCPARDRARRIAYTLVTLPSRLK